MLSFWAGKHITRELFQKIAKAQLYRGNILQHLKCHSNVHVCMYQYMEQWHRGWHIGSSVDTGCAIVGKPLSTHNQKLKSKNNMLQLGCRPDCSSTVMFRPKRAKRYQTAFFLAFLTTASKLSASTVQKWCYMHIKCHEKIKSSPTQAERPSDKTVLHWILTQEREQGEQEANKENKRLERKEQKKPEEIKQNTCNWPQK